MSRTPTIHFNPHHYTDEETSVEQIVQLYDIFRSADKNKCGRVPIGSLYISLLDVRINSFFKPSLTTNDD